MKFQNNFAGGNMINVTTATGHLITNSVFESTIAGGPSDVAITTNAFGSGSFTISNNLFTGIHYLIDQEGRDPLKARGHLDQAARSPDAAVRDNAEKMLDEIDVKRPWE